MRSTATADRLTVIAIAVMAYAAANVCHEIVGHCSAAAVVGVRCKLLSTTYIPLVKEITEFSAWKYNLILVAGSTANWTLGLVCLGLLRARPTASPSLRYFLWLSMCVNLFLPATYMTVAPIIEYGDAYYLVSRLPDQLVWRGVLVAAGACLCWLSFRLCRAELGRLVGCGRRGARMIAWELVAPAYFVGGILVVTSGLFSQLAFKWAQLQAAGGTFGLTVWLLLLPLAVPEAPAAHPFVLPRSEGWIAAGALTAAAFIGVLGRGIRL